MLRRTVLAAGAASLVWPGAHAQTRQKRIGLVIGNDAYGPGLGALRNAGNDARAVAEALKACGFDMPAGRVVIDADRKAMETAIAEHIERVKAAPDALGFFYFAGHGAARPGGGNFVMPVVTGALSEASWSEFVDIDVLLKELAGVVGPQIVCFDACRSRLALPGASRPAAGDGPTPVAGFSNVRGIAVTPGARPNQFISFATWEGEAASDGGADAPQGPYSQALAAALKRGGRRVRDMFDDVRLDVLERTRQLQEPMNLVRLNQQSRDLSVQATAPSGPAFQRKALRQALVVSCSYAGSNNPVPTTALDATRVGDGLEASGFAVTRAKDPKRADLEGLLLAFAAALNAAGSASVGVIYVAGIGASRRGKNFFVPDMDGTLPRQESDLLTRAVSFETIIGTLEGSGAAAVVMLVDCGRVFSSDIVPRGEERGFAEEFGASNVVLGYSTQPGRQNVETPEGSFYSRALAEEIRRPERRNFVDMLNAVSASVRRESSNKMTPWLQSSAKGPIYFRDGTGLDSPT